jgi:hypothetical protein
MSKDEHTGAEMVKQFMIGDDKYAVVKLTDTPKVEKLVYFTLGADEIEEKCKGITFVLTTLKNTDQVVGTLFAENGDPQALRIREISGQIHHLLVPVDIYPSLGLITYRNTVDISRPM